MEQTAALEINLFGEQLPSMNQLRALAHAINASEFNRLKFAEQVEAHMSEKGANSALTVGIGLAMLGRAGGAVPDGWARGG